MAANEYGTVISLPLNTLILALRVQTIATNTTWLGCTVGTLLISAHYTPPTVKENIKITSILHVMLGIFF